MNNEGECWETNNAIKDNDGVAKKPDRLNNFLGEMGLDPPSHPSDAGLSR